MTERTNLKAVSGEKPEKLSYGQLGRIAQGVAESCMDAGDFLLPALMILTREIISHCFDAQHVETVAMLLEDRLFAVTPAFDAAQAVYIDAERQKLLKAVGGGA